MRSVQEKQGSMAAMTMGTSARLLSSSILATAWRLASVGARTCTRSGLSVPLARDVVDVLAARAPRSGETASPAGMLRGRLDGDVARRAAS